MKKRFMAMITIVSLAQLLNADQTEVFQRGTIGGEISLYGIGMNVTGKVNSKFALRGGFDMFKMKDIEIEVQNDNGIDTNYNFDLDLQDFLLVGDYHPWEGSFRISGGMIVNNSNFDGTITPKARDGKDIEFVFNNHTYSTKEIGSVDTKVDWDPVAPYLGIGWDTSFEKEKGWGFTCDLGVAFQGSATAHYHINYGDSLKENADDTLIEKRSKQQTRDQIKKNLDSEMVELQDEMDKYKILPYISLGVNYKF